MTKKEVFNIITTDPEVMHGKPCVKGTRITVWLVVSMIADGETEEDILRNYPSLTNQSIRACLKYASFTCEYQTLPI